MNKTKFFMAVGSLVLATSAMLAAKPAKKFVGFATGNFKAQNTNIGNPTLRILNSAHFTSNSGAIGATTVRLITANNGILATLKTGVSGISKLYYH